MNYRKPAFWIVILAIVACVAVAVCFLTDPVQNTDDLSFLNYKHAISFSVQQDVIPAVRYSSEKDQGVIGICMVEGTPFSEYLDEVKWNEKWFTPSDLSSPGSVAVNVAENLRITVYDRNFAAVKFNDEVRYYRIANDDYDKMLALLLPADEERLEKSSESRFELALGVAVIEENTDDYPLNVNKPEPPYPFEATMEEITDQLHELQGLQTETDVTVYVVNFTTGEEKTITDPEEVRVLQKPISSEIWAEGYPACDNDFKITINGVDYLYHSDCGCFADLRYDCSVTVDEEDREIINEILKEKTP